MTSTSWNFPVSNKLTGRSGRNSPSTIGPMISWGPMYRSSKNKLCTDTMSSTDLLRTHSTISEPKLQLIRLAYHSSCIGLITFPLKEGIEDTPLCMMALWNRPLDSGEIRWSETLTPPALSPKMVTLLGSPPKLAMLFWTHFNANTFIWEKRKKRKLASLIGLLLVTRAKKHDLTTASYASVKGL